MHKKKTNEAREKLKKSSAEALAAQERQINNAM